MASLSNSLLLTPNPRFHSSSEFHLMPVDRCLGSVGSITNVSFSPNSLGNQQLSTKQKHMVQARYGDGGQTSTSSIFLSGFVLGGIVVGALGCVYAPKISNALAAAPDRKDLMRKLPDFIYNEEKALEKTRKILSKKIEQLSSAIDDVSSHLRSDDEVEAEVEASGEVETEVAI